MFKSTKKFQSAISVFNELDAKTFPKLLLRILQGLHKVRNESHDIISCIRMTMF